MMSSSSRMKRQRGVSTAVNGGVNNPPRVEEVATMVKKKAKKEEEQKNMVVVMKEEERKEIKDDDNGDWVMKINWEDYMPWLGGVKDELEFGDEQMSWSSTWLPAWDMDFMGEREAFNALSRDYVIWDDDIWNLKTQIPIDANNRVLDLVE